MKTNGVSALKKIRRKKGINQNACTIKFGQSLVVFPLFFVLYLISWTK
jgi:hypothetical protein